MSCKKKYCECLCTGCKWARLNRNLAGADARHCHIHGNKCHWKGCSG